RDVLAAEFVEMADRALDLYLTNRTERGFFRGLNWVLPGLSALASAVGGSILATGTLSGLPRWIVGGASLVGGIAGGLASVLKPSDELAVHLRWVRGYEDLWRDTWQYALTELPEADLVAARTKMRELAHRFTDIAEGAGGKTELRPARLP